MSFSLKSFTKLLLISNSEVREIFLLFYQVFVIDQLWLVTHIPHFFTSFFLISLYIAFLVLLFIQDGSLSSHVINLLGTKFLSTFSKIPLSKFRLLMNSFITQKKKRKEKKVQAPKRCQSTFCKTTNITSLLALAQDQELHELCQKFIVENRALKRWSQFTPG